MQKLRRLREERGLSQVKLAARADVNPSTVNQIERGARDPSPATLRKLADALDVSLVELLEADSPKGRAPLRPEPSFEEMMAAEIRGGLTDTHIINEYERIVREHRIGWRDALNDLAEPWPARIASGAFSRDMVEQFFSDMAAISKSVSRALSASTDEQMLQVKYKTPPTAEDTEEMWNTAITYAAANLLKISDEVYEAASTKFSESELENVRRKRAEARQALGRAA